jgi:hypothetical protein
MDYPGRLIVRYLVISDIHGNREALDAVLGAIARAGLRPRARPRRSRRLRRRPQRRRRIACESLDPLTIIRGNHDMVASGLENGDSFNLVARSAVQWTYEMLTPDNLEYLLKLPAGPIAVDDQVEICPRVAFDEDAYIFDELDALRAFEVSNAARVPVRVTRTSPSPTSAAGPPWRCRRGPETPTRCACRSYRRRALTW